MITVDRVNLEIEAAKFQLKEHILKREELETKMAELKTQIGDFDLQTQFIEKSITMLEQLKTDQPIFMPKNYLQNLNTHDEGLTVLERKISEVLPTNENEAIPVAEVRYRLNENGHVARRDSNITRVLHNMSQKNAAFCIEKTTTKNNKKYFWYK